MNIFATKTQRHKDSIKELRNGKTLEIIGLLTLIIFLVTFIYGLK